MAVDSTPGTIPVDKLMLDIENPRLLHEVIAGTAPTTQQELEDSISSAASSKFKALFKSIKKTGVQNAIWVLPQSDGTYLVKEGNRRTTILRKLLREGIQPPSGVEYDKVPANIIDKSATDMDVKLLCARIQTGQAEWGAFNEGALISDLHNNDNMALEDIAIELQKPVTQIKKQLKSYKMFLEYSAASGDVNPRRFAYFNEAPKKVLEWVDDSPRNKKDYHKWINPTNGAAKIRSAATKGGLRDFSKIIDDGDAIQLMREDTMANVEDAMEVVKQNDIKKDMPFLARLLPFQAQLNGLSDEQKARIASEPRMKVHLKSLKTACENLLKELESYDA